MSATTTIEIEFIFKMESDWCVSTGIGRQGALDSTVHRDADGFPCLPFTTIRGMWRDSAEQLAFALDGGTSTGPWADAVPLLFGDEPAKPGYSPSRKPRPSRVFVTDGRLPQDLRKALAGKKRAQLRNSLTFVKPGVAIDRESGTALDDHLRFDEMARAGLELHGSATLDLSAVDQPEHAANFLKAALLLITHIGGNRRRGAGQCVVELKTMALPGLLKSLEQARPPGEKPVTKPTPVQAPNITTNDVWIADLKVHLVSQTVIPSEVLGNVITCDDYIPGTFLLAPVASYLAQKLGLGKAQIMAAIAAGHIRVEPAYPARDGLRGRPTPGHWNQYKDNAGGPNGKGAIIEGFPALHSEAFDANKIAKPVGERFFVVSADPERLTLFAAKKSVGTHNVINDDLQRPDATVGGVFTYEGFSPGQDFLSQVHIHGDLLNGKKLQGNCRARIGRANATGYGAVLLTFGEAREVSRSGAAKGTNLLYVETPVILPQYFHIDERNGVREAVADLFGLTASSIEVMALRYQRIEGWVSNWGLPRRSLMAIAPGSVLQIKLQEQDVDKCNAALLQGVGTRLGEGFGQVSVFEGVASKLLTQTPESRNTGDESESSFCNIESTRLAKVVERAAVEQAIRIAAEEVTQEESVWSQTLGWTKSTNPSQLGNLRSVMGKFDHERKEKVLKFLKNAKSQEWTKTAMEFFEVQEKVWTRLGISDLESLLLVQDVDRAKKTYWPYAMTCFVHAVMTHHRNQSG